MIKIRDYKIDFFKSSLSIPELDIPDRGITLICGDNGIGKTTFVRSILRININYHGTILINEIENNKLRRIQISRLISYLPQIENSVFSIMVEDFIKQGLYAVKKNYFDEVIDMLDLSCYLKKDYRFLSGGERQLVKIARAIIPDVAYTILDEPDTFLSKKNREKVKTLIEYFAEKRGFIIVSHTKNEFTNKKMVIDFENFLLG